ncbi:hypothetical protein [Bartonella sp. B30(2025)]
MKKIFTQGLLAANILTYSHAAFAGFGEKNWSFAPNESITISKSDIIPQGVEYSCKVFNPSKASFTLSYSASSDLDKLGIVADDKEKITHDKKNKIFILKDITSLDISFPSSGNYIFKNITNQKVIGIGCDTGDYD